MPGVHGNGRHAPDSPNHQLREQRLGLEHDGEHRHGGVSSGGATDTCDGSSFLRCSGAARTGGWDGPAIDILPYAAPGSEYRIAVAARFAPTTPPSAASAIRLVCAKACSDSAVSNVYAQLQQQTTISSWVRLDGEIEATPMSGCDSLSRLLCYVETDSPEADLSVHLDDFRLYDRGA